MFFVFFIAVRFLLLLKHVKRFIQNVRDAFSYLRAVTMKTLFSGLNLSMTPTVKAFELSYT